MEQLEVVSLILFRGFDVDDRAPLMLEAGRTKGLPKAVSSLQDCDLSSYPAPPPTIRYSPRLPSRSSFVYGIQVNQAADDGGGNKVVA